MTAQAVREVANTLFLVFLRNFALIVLMAGVASVSRVAIGMAGRAGPAGVTMIHGEAMGAIVGGRSPGIGRVAQGAIEPEHTGVEGRVSMALEASRRRIDVLTTRVTL